jgi:hypothetical protein
MVHILSRRVGSFAIAAALSVLMHEGAALADAPGQLKAEVTPGVASRWRGRAR